MQGSSQERVQIDLIDLSDSTQNRLKTHDNLLKRTLKDVTEQVQKSADNLSNLMGKLASNEQGDSLLECRLQRMVNDSLKPM